MNAFGYKPIERPIFIIGAGRSGTTIFYNLLSGHRNLGWFYESWLSRRIKSINLISYLAFQNVLYKNLRLSQKYRKKAWFPKPSEGYYIWDLFHPVDDGSASKPLKEKDVDIANIKLMKEVIKKHLFFGKANRFVNKNTRNSRRMRYLYKIFPDALFIHVKRDSLAVINSLLNVGFWPTLKLWWYGGRTPSELEKEGKDPVLISAKHWKAGVERIYIDKEYIPNNQFTEISYENLIKFPIETMQNVLNFCDLPWTKSFEKHIKSFALKNKNYKWLKMITDDQIKTIRREIEYTLEHSYIDEI